MFNLNTSLNINLLLFDIGLGVILFFIIMGTIVLTEKLYKKRKTNPWVNRKLIHLSTIPAVLAYMFWFNYPYVFWAFAFFFTVMVMIPHMRKKEIESFQLKENFGEVYYCFMWLIISILFWESRIIAGILMLFMALGDAVTGLVRFYITKIPRRHKHWYGSLAMFIVCSIIIYAFLMINPIISIIISAIVTLSEAQDIIDDNISVPLIGAVLFKLIGIL